MTYPDSKPKLPGAGKTHATWPPYKFYDTLSGEPYLTDSLGEAGPSEGAHIPDPLQSLQLQAKQLQAKQLQAKQLQAKQLQAKQLQAKQYIDDAATQLSDNSMECTESKVLKAHYAYLEGKGRRMAAAFLPPSGSLPQKPKSATSAAMPAHRRMPDRYHAGKLFDMMYEIAEEVIATGIKSDTESLELSILKRVSDTVAELLMDERKTLQQFKTNVEGWTQAVAEDMAQLELQMCELANDLNTARKEVLRLEQENRSLRVSGTLKKLPRKVRNSR